MNIKTALYPGTFDPPTNGHVDIALRARKMFDRVIIAVADNPNKGPVFNIDERLEMLNDIFKDNDNIEIKAFSDLLVNYAKEQNAVALVRGLRAVSDFEYELQLASFNHYLAEDIETVFLMARDENLFVSSSIIKEVAFYQGDVSGKVPEPVWNKLKQKYNF